MGNGGGKYTTYIWGTINSNSDIETKDYFNKLYRVTSYMHMQF